MKLEKDLDFSATTKTISVLSTFFSYYIQNIAATGKKINYIPDETRIPSTPPAVSLCVRYSLQPHFFCLS